MRKVTVLALSLLASAGSVNWAYAQGAASSPCSSEDERKYKDAEETYRRHLASPTSQKNSYEYWQAAISRLSPTCQPVIWQWLRAQSPGAGQPSGCTQRQLQAMIAANGNRNYQGPLADCRSFPR